MYGGKYTTQQLLALKEEHKTCAAIAAFLGKPPTTVVNWFAIMKRRSNRTLYIPDLHIPAMKEGFDDWCLLKAKKHGCTTIILGGDVIDNDYLKRYDPNLDYYNPKGEYLKAKEILKALFEKLKDYEVIWILGNHDERMNPKARRDRTPSWFIKSIRDVYGVPDNVLMTEKFYTGDTVVKHSGYGNIKPHVNLRDIEHCNAVVFHNHSLSALHAVRTAGGFYWGCVVGCGIDTEHLACEYMRTNKTKFIWSCLVVDNKQPYLYWHPDNWNTDMA